LTNQGDNTSQRINHSLVFRIYQLPIKLSISLTNQGDNISQRINHSLVFRIHQLPIKLSISLSNIFIAKQNQFENGSSRVTNKSSCSTGCTAFCDFILLENKIQSGCYGLRLLFYGGVTFYGTVCAQNVVRSCGTIALMVGMVRVESDISEVNWKSQCYKKQF